MERLFVIILEAEQQKAKPFNFDSAIVFNTGNLAMVILWVLRVDGTRMSTEIGTPTVV